MFDSLFFGTMINYLFDDDMTFILFTSFISIYLAFVSMFILTKRNEHKKNKAHEENAFKLLLKGYEQNSLKESSIMLIYKKEIVQKHNNITYVNFLESFLIYVRQEDKDGSLTNDLSCLIEPIIIKAESEKPFSNVEERERRLLLAIEESALNGETASLKNNLTDLSLAIENNKCALDKAQKTNKWTIPISVVGIILSIVFWIAGSSLSEKDVQRISNQIVISISDSMSSTTTNNP